MSEASTTSIRHCSCAHKAQDEMYGRGKRVFNQTLSGWRCTVCSNEQIPSGLGKKGKRK